MAEARPEVRTQALHERNRPTATVKKNNLFSSFLSLELFFFLMFGRPLECGLGPVSTGGSGSTKPKAMLKGPPRSRGPKRKVV